MFYSTTVFGIVDDDFNIINCVKTHVAAVGQRCPK